MGDWQGDGQWNTGADGEEENGEFYRFFNESDVLAILDPTTMLDIPPVWNPDKSVTLTFTPTTSETHPNRGIAFVLNWRTDSGRVATRSPSASGFRLHFSTPPPASSGLVGWIGMANDLALARVGFSGMDWDSPDPRGRVGGYGGALPGSIATATRPGLVDARGGVIYGSGKTLADDSREVYRAVGINNADGTHNTATQYASQIHWTGQTYPCFGIFPHLASAQRVVTMRPSAFIRQLRPGERY